MKLLFTALACLLFLSAMGQDSLSDSLHTHSHINYNFKTHKNATMFKYAGVAIASLGSSINLTPPAFPLPPACT